MEHPITAISKVLLLPRLEEETIKDVNQAIRALVGPYIRAKPPDGDETEQSLNPFDKARHAVDGLFGAGVFAEWTEGASEVKEDG